MGYDPEYQRAYRAANRDRIRENQRANYQANRDQILEQRRQYREARREELAAKQRERYRKKRAELGRVVGDRPKADPVARANYKKRWREENSDHVREQRHAYYEANRETVKAKAREWFAANRDRALEQHRQYRLINGYKKPRERERDSIVIGLWTEQQGCCYLCDEPLELAKAVIEHDHRCCPQQNTFCRFCVRGVSCQQCNKILAFARDDPARLRRIADNLEPMLAIVAERMVAKPSQLVLDESA